MTAISDEVAIEQILATNMNFLIQKRLREASMALAIVTKEDPNYNPLLNAVARSVIQSLDLIGAMHDRYDTMLGEIKDADPDRAQRLKDVIAKEDLITTFELIMRMSADDRLEQLRLRGK